MLYLWWIIGAFWGLLFSLFIALPGGGALLIGSSLFFFGASCFQGLRVRSFFLASSGFLWVGFGNAPSPKKPVTQMKILGRELLVGEPQLGESIDGNIYLVQGKASADSSYHKVYLRRDMGELFHPIKAYLHKSVSSSIPEIEFISSLQESLRKYLTKALEEEKSQAPWLKSLLLGDRRGLSFRTHQIFSTLGLYHLLVLSGLHVSFLGFFFLKSFLLILRVFYAGRLLSPRQYVFFTDFLSLFVCVLLFFYASVVGFTLPVQRALLSYIVYTLCRVCCFGERLRDRLLFVLFSQLFFFPTGFLDNSSCLSWGSFLVVLVGLEWKGLSSFFSLIGAQVALTLLVSLFCGKLSFLGLLLNPVFIPVFSLIYSLSLVIIMKDLFPPVMISLALGLQNTFLSCLEVVAILPQWYTWLFLDLYSYSSFLRVFLILVVLIFFHYLLKSIKEK